MAVDDDTTREELMAAIAGLFPQFISYREPGNPDLYNPKELFGMAEMARAKYSGREPYGLLLGLDSKGRKWGFKALFKDTKEPIINCGDSVGGKFPAYTYRLMDSDHTPHTDTDQERLNAQGGNANTISVRTESIGK